MKRIITMVGTSIFTNRFENNTIRTKYKELEKEPYEYWEEQLDAGNIEELKTATKQALNRDQNDSAEIKSILAIANELKEDVDVYLLATDTVVSRLACELVKEWFTENYKGKLTIDVKKFNEQQDVMKGLQVEDSQTFKKEGLISLMTRFYAICGNYFDDVIISITGGYKVIIPYLTILGQVNKVPVKYIFEDTNTLIEIPFLPLTIDSSLFGKYEKEFDRIDKETSLKKQEYYEFIKEAFSCLEMTGEEVSLNSLGIMLWENYKSKYFFFYANDEVMKEIECRDRIKKIISETFWEKQSRDLHIVCEGTHKTVFKQYSNVQRIYYFEYKNEIFIYKIFEDHGAHERYIKTTHFDEQLKHQVIKDSKLQKVKKMEKRI